MSVKEHFIEWLNGDEITEESWKMYQEDVGMEYTMEYFHNVICAKEKEEIVKDLPHDPGMIGGGMMEDYST